MAGKLFNVRLDEADAARARSLQKAGLELSQVMREAIRAAHAKHANGRRPKRSLELLRKIYQEIPELPGAEPLAVNVHDRAAFQEYVRDHLTRKPRAGTGPARHKRPRRARRAAR